MAGPFDLDLLEHQLLGKRILAAVDEDLAIFQEPHQITALVIPVVERPVARGNRANSFRRHRLPLQPRPG